MEISNRRQFLLGATGLATAKASAPPPPSTGARDSLLRLSDGRQLSFRIFGDLCTAPILYFHGSPGSRLEAELVATAAPGTGLIAVDRPGIGRSTLSRNSTIESWPSDIAQLIDFLDSQRPIDRVGILAVSAGTPFSLACAEKLPEIIGAVAILSPRTPLAPGVPLSAVDQKLLQAKKNPRLARLYLRRQLQLLRRRSPKAGTMAFGMFAPIDQSFAKCHTEQFRRTILEAGRCGTDGILNDFLNMLWPWPICLPAVDSPVSLWHGRCDYAAPSQTLDFLAANLKTVHSVTARDQGHFTMLAHAAKDSTAWLQDHLA